MPLSYRELVTCFILRGKTGTETCNNNQTVAPPGEKSALALGTTLGLHVSRADVRPTQWTILCNFLLFIC